MATLLEKYNSRLKVCESVYRNEHPGEAMPEYKKLMIARVVDNTKKFLTENFAATAATQGPNATNGSFGDYKKFCLNLTSIALPNLIGTDLVITQPMTSVTGFITYLQYTAGIDKGGVAAGQVFNSAFRIGDMNESRINYSGKAVVEPIETFTSGTTTLAFIHVVANVRLLDADGVQVDNADGNSPATVDDEGVVTQTSFKAGKTAADVKKVAYTYDNEIIPQQNALPTLKANLKNLELRAKTRRIAVYYSQIAAYQAKTDYGFDLGQQIAEQAVGELRYEIDSAIVDMLAKGAELDTSLVWSKKLPVGVSKEQHYEGFLEVLEAGRAIMYKRTQKFSPNWMLTDAANIPVLSFMRAWTPSNVTIPNGPYFAGSINGIRVYVSPMLDDGKFILGVKGNDLQSAAGFYAPYMVCLPTQVIGLPDGTMEQGFSCMDDMGLLSTYELVDGVKVDSVKTSGEGVYSYLLVGGKITNTEE